MPAKRSRPGTTPAAVLVSMALALSPAGAHAQKWENHIDASMINEIVPRGNVLYMATFGGLVLYDVASGTFEQYNNVSGLPSNSINCLAFDAGGDIYIGTADIGVAKVRLENGRLTLLRSLSEQIDGLAGNSINAIAPWGTDIVYGSTPGAGTIRNDFASARYFERDGLPGPDVHDVLPFGDRVWMATDGGVATLDALGIIEEPAGGPAEANVLGTDGTTLWVGTDDGVRRYDPAGPSWTDVGPDTREMYSLAWDGTTMWGGSDRNVFRYNSGVSWAIYRADSIQNRYNFTGGTGQVAMKGLAVYPGPNVYFGSAHPTDLRGPGLMHFDGTRILNLKSSTPGANDIRRLAVDTDGAVWASFATFYVGKLMPSGGWLNYNTSVPGIQLPSSQSTNLTCIVDDDGHKWFSSLSVNTSPRPIDELDDGFDASYGNDAWVRHPLNSGGGDGLGSLRPVRAAVDPAGNRWFCSDAFEASSGWQGIQILSRDKSAWLQMTPIKDPRMASGDVVDVAFAGTFAYVAFKAAGVHIWSHGGYDWNTLTGLAADAWIERVKQTQLPASGVISRLLLRSDGRLWIATSAGLFYLESGQLKEIPVFSGIGPGIISGGVQDLAFDHEENLWVATDLGLNRIGRDDENDIQTFTTPATFVAISGLRYPLDIISPLAHSDVRSLAVHRTKDILYIGTYGGMSIYDFSPPPPTDTDLSKVYVYPNPVQASRGHASLKIANLTGPVTVEIYNLEGELVDTRTASADGDVVWDLKTRDGFFAGSANYIVRIVGAHGSVQRPIALIR